MYNFKAFKKQVYNDLSYDEENQTREIQPSKNKIVLVKQLGTNKYKFLDSDEIFDEKHLKSLIKAKKTNPDDYNLTYVVGVIRFDCEALTDGVWGIPAPRVDTVAVIWFGREPSSLGPSFRRRERSGYSCVCESEGVLAAVH